MLTKILRTASVLSSTKGSATKERNNSDETSGDDYPVATLFRVVLLLD